MPARRSVPAGLAAHLPAAAVGVTWLAGAAMSWRRLGSLLVDGGRDPEVARQLLEGAVLYRDVRWYWGPLAPAVNTLAFAALGVSLDALMWTGLLAAALATWGMFRLARSFVGPWTSASVAIAFVLGCAFSQRIDQAIFNFVLPFNTTATYGFVAAVFGVDLLVRHALGGARGALFGSALLAGVAALGRAELAFAVAAAHAAFAIASWRRLRRVHVAAWAAGAGVALAGYGAAWLAAGDALFRSMSLLANPSSRAYVADTMGLDTIGFSLLDAALSGIFVGLGAWAVRRAARFAESPARSAEASGAAALGAFAASFLLSFAIAPGILFRAAPFVGLLAVGVLLARAARAGAVGHGGEWAARLVVWTFATAMVARIVLAAGVDHYGFFLVPPMFVAYALLLAVHAPARLRASPRAARTLAAGAIGLLVGIAASSARVSLPRFLEPRAVLDAPRAHLLVSPRASELAVVPLLARLPPPTRVAAIPQGAGLAFAAGLSASEDGMTSYLPMELPDDRSDLALLERWSRKPPDVVVYWRDDMRRSYGSAGFGVDYARRSAFWLADRYKATAEPASGFYVLEPAR